MVKTALDTIPMPRSAELLGWRLIDARPQEGWIKVGFDGKPEFCNPAGFVQGGILSAMLDDTMGPAVLVMTEGRSYTTTVSLTVNFLNPAKLGPIISEAQVTQLGKSIAFVEGKLTAADGTLRRWRDLVADWADEPSKPMCADYWSAFTNALDDDLDTPAALRTLRELARDAQIPAGSKFETFAAADRVLGLDLVSLVGRPRSRAVLPAGAEQKLAERAAARDRKDFAASDRLRTELAAMGVSVADTPDGQTWTVTAPA